MRRVLVTGAGGFVGRPAVTALVERGYEVHAIGRRALGVPEGVVGHAVDLLDGSSTAGLVREIGATHMLHLAWDVTPGRFWRGPGNLEWVAASLRLYRAFVDGGGTRLVVAGTCAEYGWGGGLLDEATTPLEPATLYGAAKDSLRRVMEAAAAVDGVSMAWGRLFLMYGPHEARNRLVPDVVEALIGGVPALCGDGVAERDFMHVADVAGGLVATLDSRCEGAVNIASGVCVPIRQVVEILARLAGRPELLRLGARASPPGEPPRLAATVARLRDEVGYVPRFGLEEGLADTLGWWQRVTA